MYIFGCILAFLLLMNDKDVDKLFGVGINNELNGQQKVLVLSLISLGSWLTLFIYFLDKLEN